MTCRMCDKFEPRGCGETCCAVDKHVIMSFDENCKFTEEEIEKYENTISNKKDNKKEETALKSDV